MTIEKSLSLKQWLIKYGLQKPLEGLISLTTKAKGNNFYNLEQFSWAKHLEENYEAIRKECINIAKPENIPNIQDVLSQEAPIAREQNWKVYFLYFFWNLVKEHSQTCPQTTQTIKQIPGLVSAFFSILAPGKKIPEHYGSYKGVLRCHLGLIIPADENSCGLKVGSEIEHWSAGKLIVFDDTKAHSAWNHSQDEYRIVLFIDFLRPLPFFVHVLNKLFYRFLSTDKDIQEGFAYLKQSQLTLTPDPF